MQRICGCIHRFLDHANRHGRLANRLSGELDCPIDGLTRRTQLVDQTPVECPVGRQLLAHQADSLCPGGSDQGHQSRQRAPLQIDADLHFRYVEKRLLCRNPPVARECQGHAAANGHALDRSNRDLRQPLPGLAHPHAAVEHLPSLEIAGVG